MKSKRITIEPSDEGDAFVVYEHGTYEAGRILEGQPNRAWRDACPVLAAAVKAYPAAEVLNYSTRSETRATLPHCPPSWFDPDFAGEHWGEDY